MSDENGRLWIIVDVGCIECGEQTEVRGIAHNFEDAKALFEKIEESLGIKKREARGGFLELLGLNKKAETTYCGGTDYFEGGQHALELHGYPATSIKQVEDQQGVAR